MGKTQEEKLMPRISCQPWCWQKLIMSGDKRVQVIAVSRD